MLLRTYVHLARHICDLVNDGSLVCHFLGNRPVGRRRRFLLLVSIFSSSDCIVDANLLRERIKACGVPRQQDTMIMIQRRNEYQFPTA